ncbi:MAG: hypothetical protein AB1646_17670 [Thermodesulfobacteriota bacterium]
MTVLVDARPEAASRIGLELSAAQAAMLNATPRGALEKTIARTTVLDPQRSVFLDALGYAVMVLLCFVGSAWAGKAQLDPDPYYLVPSRVLSREEMLQRQMDMPRDMPLWEPPMWETRETVRWSRAFQTRARLTATFLRGEPNVLTVAIKYDCPFATGIIVMRPLDFLGLPAPKVHCEPRLYHVFQGNGEVTFTLQGRSAVTGWLLVGLLDGPAVLREVPNMLEPVWNRATLNPPRPIPQVRRWTFAQDRCTGRFGDLPLESGEFETHYQRADALLLRQLFKIPPFYEIWLVERCVRIWPERPSDAR